MLGILFSLFTICFLASSVDVFLYFFPLLFAKYIMTLYLPWPRALRPLCGFTILAISQINHRSLCRNISLHEDSVIFMVEEAGLYWVVGLLHLQVCLQNTHAHIFLFNQHLVVFIKATCYRGIFDVQWWNLHSLIKHLVSWAYIISTCVK